MTSLYIVASSKIKKMYEEHIKTITNMNENSGFDLLIPNDYDNKNKDQITIDHMISAMVMDENNNRCGYWMVPRSSISKTNFRMANSIGLIDPGYNGNLLAKVDVIKQTSNPILITKGSRLFQICSADLKPFKKIHFVESLPKTIRGNGGFGSTNKRYVMNDISKLGYVI